MRIVKFTLLWNIVGIITLHFLGVIEYLIRVNTDLTHALIGYSSAYDIPMGVVFFGVFVESMSIFIDLILFGLIGLDLIVISYYLITESGVKK